MKQLEEGKDSTKVRDFEELAEELDSYSKIPKLP